MATLLSTKRHSMGDLTLYIFDFSAITTTDSYAVTNMAGVVDCWINCYAGANTLATACVDHTNSDTGTTFTIYGAIAASATVYAIGVG